MESIYYVMCWACHRRCKHCYEARFRPYARGALEEVLREAAANFPRIIDHFPERMTYRDLEAPAADGSLPEKVGRVILSGGESLIEPVRERVTYPVIERLAARYRGQGGVKIVVQTTGDLVTEAVIDALLQRGVWMISVAGVDDFHVGLEGEAKQAAFREGLTRLFERAGMKRSGLSHTLRKWHEEEGPLFSFFGATPDSWIGKLWPRGRAWANDLSTATLADNFCNRWSGGLGFLQHRYSGSEVSIEPNGDVYPCCLKTKLPIGNLIEENLIDILDSLVGEPAYEAISMGHPERMGIADGWSVERFLERSRTVTPSGRPYQNLCIGCDAFHAERLGPVLARARERRRASRAGVSQT
ncbi:MAG TPA: radical SAM/SPASM domain-containing protein [Stellaceae bacterium]|nr:radical SAM/SPASM domain-containing protein [Stellaceae bacterium]